MRKSTKLAILVAALVALCSFAAYATGWVQEGGEWYYADSNGDYVTNVWKTSGANQYYLGDDGAMLTSQLVDDGTNVYYVNETGAKVCNAWVQIEADDEDADLGVDYRWYYFGAAGKAYKDSLNKAIGGKKYGFDSNGKMLFGFVAADKTINTDNDAILVCDYYFGTNDDGARFGGWLEYTDGFDSSDYDGNDSYWFYYKPSTGLKYKDVVKKIGNKKYSFDVNGAMVNEWIEGTNSEVTEPVDITKVKYYDEDGSLKKSCWIYAVPDKAINASDNADSTSRWFYLNSNGNPTANTTKKINGKWYTFNNVGIMKSGLVALNLANPGTISGATIDEASLTDQTADYIKGLGVADIAYFSGDAVNDGSAKSGTIKLDLADDTYTFNFGKNFIGTNGLSSKKVYINGILQCAGDDKYTVVENTNGAAGQYEKYIVNAAGTVQTSNAALKDADDNYYAIHKQDDGTLKYWHIVAGDDASKAASQLKQTGTTTYSVNYLVNGEVIDFI